MARGHSALKRAALCGISKMFFQRRWIKRLRALAGGVSGGSGFFPAGCWCQAGDAAGHRAVPFLWDSAADHAPLGRWLQAQSGIHPHFTDISGETALPHQEKQDILVKGHGSEQEGVSFQCFSEDVTRRALSS